MNRYDLDFKNVFGVLGIESLEMHYVKTALINELKKKQSAIISKKYKDRMHYKFAPVELKSKLELARKEFELAKEQKKSPDLIRQLEEKVNKLNEEYVYAKNALEVKLPVKEMQANEKRDDLEERIADVNITNDFFGILCTLISARIEYLKVTYEAELEKGDSNSDEIRSNLDEINAIGETLNSKEAVKQYTLQHHEVLANVDFANHDMTKYQYVKPKRKLQAEVPKMHLTSSKLTGDRIREGFDNEPPFKFVVKVNQRPKKYFEDAEAQIYSYELGKFQYGMHIKPDGKPTYTSLQYDIIGVIRPDETGEYKSYHAVVYSKNIEPEFKKKVMLSPMILRNAERNFGFLGTLEDVPNARDGEYKTRIIFNGIGDQDLVRALSYAQTYPGVVITKEGNKKATLGEVFEKFDKSMDFAIYEGIYARMDKSLDVNSNDGWTQGED